MAQRALDIDLDRQTLCLLEHDVVRARYRVSTARNGAGERLGSECTPRGRHVIAARIGDGAPVGTVFVGRVATGECYTPAWAATQPPGRDYILTRILWLAGCEPGRNQGGDCDTYARYIYIHGTPDDTALGRPGSRGCIRMRNAELAELYALVDIGTPVFLHCTSAPAREATTCNSTRCA
jgi:hypothetical protein